MFRIYSNEQTKLAFDGTPEAKVHDRRTGKPHVEADAPPRGLPDGHPVGLRSVIKPGVNEISDNEYALLNQDIAFQAAVKGGFIVFLNEDGATIDPPLAPKYKAEAVGGNPAASKMVNEGAETLPSERTDAHAAQTGDKTNSVTGKPVVKGGKVPPAEAPEVNQQVETYFGLSEADRVAYYEALSDDEKALVASDPRSKPKE